MSSSFVRSLGVAVLTAVALLSCAPAPDPATVPERTPAAAAPSEPVASPSVLPADGADPGQTSGAAPPAPDRSATVGDLLVAPTRLVFEGNSRSAEITLINVGPAAATYRISLIHLQMNEAGELSEVEEPPPGMKVADGLLRFSPRQVFLEPNVAQTIRIQLRKPADLEPGEYRSHMLFRAVPPPEVMSGDPEAPSDQGISIRLIPIYGVSIPVIVRHATDDSSARLSDVKVEPPAQNLPAGSVTALLTRTGQESVYGNLKVIHQSPGGEAREVGYIGGVAVYPPVERRAVRVPLRSVEGVDLRSGRLLLTYTGEPPNEVRLAEAELALP